MKQLLRFCLLVVFWPLSIIVRLVFIVFNLRVSALRSNRVGHFAGNIDTYLAEKKHGINYTKKTIDLFYINQPISNKCLYGLWRRVLHISWFYRVLDCFNFLLPGYRKFRVSFINRERDIHGVTARTPAPVCLTAKQLRQGDELMKQYGLSSEEPLYLFSCRDSAFLRKTSNNDCSYHDYRDSNIENHKKAAEMMSANGFQVIRMGRHVHKKITYENENIFDYSSSSLASDFMDLYLTSRCSFYVGDSSGIVHLPALFRRPVAVLNVAAIEFATSWGSPFLVFIPKKLYDQEQEKFLSLREIYEAGLWQAQSSEEYEQKGVVAVENSTDEICAVVEEMYQRVNGNWLESEDDRLRQQKFWNCFKQYAGKKNHGVYKTQIGSKFLAQNIFLLEELD